MTFLGDVVTRSDDVVTPSTDGVAWHSATLLLIAWRQRR
jgi:hypothetical protein